jgi:hypothetical protein
MTASPRSVFVSTIGWSFVALSGMGTMITILQNVMVHTFFNGSDFDQAMRTMPADTPWVFRLMLANFKTFIGLMLAASLTMLTASIGLLLRKNWARILMIVLMIGSALSQLLGLIAQFSVIGHMRQQLAAAPGAPDMSFFLVAIVVFSAIFGLGFCFLFGWIAKRLMSPEIAAEFGR